MTKQPQVFKDSKGCTHPWVNNDGVSYTPLNKRPIRFIRRLEDGMVLVEIAKPKHLRYPDATPVQTIGEFDIYHIEIRLSTYLDCFSA